MNTARVELKLVLSQAGIGDIKLDSFSQRFNVQKRIYLTQVMGYDLGYRFSWYLRGPYCRGLTEEAFILKDELNSDDNEYESYELSSVGIANIDRAKRLWEIPEDTQIDNDSWLELLSSLHYLKHIAYWPKDTDKVFNSVFNKLIESKPQFENSKEVAEKAWERLDKHGLIEKTTSVSNGGSGE